MAIQIRNLSARVDELSARESQAPIEVLHPTPPPPPVELPPPVITKEEVDIMKRQLADLTLKLTSYSKEIPVLETTLTHKLEHYTLRIVKDRMDNMPTAAAAPVVDVKAIQDTVLAAIRADIKQEIESLRREVVAAVAAQPSTTTTTTATTTSFADVNSVIETLSNTTGGQEEDIELSVGTTTAKKRTVRKKAMTVL